jgi:hypothetical protein
MLKISIPVPCHEDWNNMTPDETGRHCSSCAKSVVDFTGMSDEEVKHFFLIKKEERVCGRFKQTQLHSIVIELPQNIFSLQMPLWKKFLAACLVVFSTTLFSCETRIQGKADAHIQTQKVDTNPFNEHLMLGGIGYSITPDSIKTIEVCSTTVGELYLPPLIKGDIDIVEVQPVPLVVVPVKDTIYKGLIEEEPTINLPATATKTKNPPEADSINCKTIKNYY